MQTGLYIFWIFIPGLYAIFALYSTLEAASKKSESRKEESRNLVKQSVFLAVAALLTYLIDLMFLIPKGAELIASTPLPSDTLWVLKVLLFPLLVFVLGKISGGTEELKIKNPHQRAKEQIEKNKKRRKKR